VPTLDFGPQPVDFGLGLVKAQPTLETDRLLLRPLLLQDDLFVRELANNPKIESMNLWPLHGYGRKMVRRWIGGKRAAWKDGTAAEFGIELKSGGELLGLVGLDSIDAAQASAELSFLLHERFWRQDHVTEAAARHPATLSPQPSTLNRCLLRAFARKGDAFHDLLMMAPLRKEWPPGQKLYRPAASIAT
jgi:hypothetical protein